MIHTRKTLLLFFSLLFIINFSNGQTIDITGQVFVQNSRDENGKIKMVKNVKIKSPYSKTVSTDVKGRFSLKLIDADPNETIFFQVNKSGYEVIDVQNLKYTLIDKKTKLRIFIAPKGYMQKTRLNLTNSAINALDTEKERLLDLLVFGGKATDAAIKTINSRTGIKVYTAYEAEELLLQMYEDVKKNIRYSAYELAVVNPDFASDDFLVAISHYLQGDILEAVAILQDEIDEDESIEDILSIIREGKNSTAISHILTNRERKVEQIKNNLMLQSIALQQNYRLKESNEVLIELSNINTVAPTQKMSKFIETVDFYDVTKSAQDKDTPLVNNNSAPTSTDKTNSNNANILSEEVVKVTPPQEIIPNDATPIAKKEEVKKDRIQYKVSPTKKIVTTDIPLKNKEKKVEKIIDNQPRATKKIATATKKEILTKKENLASSTTNNTVPNEPIPTSYDILSSKGNDNESLKQTTTVTQIVETPPSIQPTENTATTTATTKATAPFTAASSQKNTITNSNIPTTSPTPSNDNDWVIVDYQPQTNSTSMIVETTKPVVIENNNSVIVEDYRPIPTVKKSKKVKDVRRTVPSSSRYAITKRTSLRQSPTAKSKVLKRLAVGTEMVIIEHIDKYWCKVILNGKEGYVKSFLLEEAD